MNYIFDATLAVEVAVLIAVFDMSQIILGIAPGALIFLVGIVAGFWLSAGASVRRGRVAGGGDSIIAQSRKEAESILRDARLTSNEKPSKLSHQTEQAMSARFKENALLSNAW